MVSNIRFPLTGGPMTPHITQQPKPKYPTFGDDDLRPGDHRRPDNRQPNDSRPGLLSSFLPGQRNSLAQQLNQGFGGGFKQWNGILGQSYPNMGRPDPGKYPMPDDPRNRPDRPDRPDKPGDKPGDQPTPVFDPWGHDGGAMMLQQRMQAMQGQGAPVALPPQVGQQMQAPGMIPGPIPQQQQQNPGMFGQQQSMLSPQVIAMLRQQLGRM